MTIEFGGNIYRTIPIDIQNPEAQPRCRLLKSRGHTFIGCNPDEALYQRLGESLGLVIAPSSMLEPALFTGLGLILLCKPAASYCPICYCVAPMRAGISGGPAQCDCPRCGSYRIENLTIGVLEFEKKKHPTASIRLSHGVRILARAEEVPLIRLGDLQKLAATELPETKEQFHLLAEWLATASHGVRGKPVQFDDPLVLAGVLGVIDEGAVAFVVSQMQSCGLVAVMSTDTELPKLALTAKGWELLAEVEPAAITGIDSAERVARWAVILTALEVETRAVLRHIPSWEEKVVRDTVFYRGRFKDWDIAVAEVGAGNPRAAAIAERAIQHFKPDVALFIGIAGGIKDVTIGDVVVATKVYGDESGKEDDCGFRFRPEVQNTAHALEQRGRAIRLRPHWQERLSSSDGNRKPRIYVGPIAAGEKVIASSQARIAQLLRKHYSDALAVEMEGRGFLEGVHINVPVQGCVIRGISDLLEGKADADAAGTQEVAADAASAVAFEMLATLPKENAEQ